MMKNKTRIAGAAVVLFAAAALMVAFTSAGAGASPSSTTVPRAAVGDGGQPATAADGLKDLKIAFTRLCAVSLPPAGCAPSVEHQGAEIWTMNGDGSQQRQLTHNTTWDLAPVWSPHGSTIAFYGTQFDPITDKALAPPHIYLVNANSGNQTLLTDHTGRFPSYSPDGKQIAFDDGADIFVINADGTGTPTNLTQDPTARNIRPDWSPDGNKIAFTSRRSGCDAIYVMNADGSDVAQLTGTPTCTPSSTPKPPADNAPAWSPNGQKIVFQRTLSDGNDEIYVMNADGSDQTRLTDYPGRDDDPDWSPDGRWIAFHREIDPISAGILEVFLMNADDSNQITQLTGTDDQSENAHPGWDPKLAP